jgi:beta-lactamase regulating signal transducer with metallopeptidase domain
MTSELTRSLLALTLASSVGILAALLLRRAARRMFGAVASYSMWLFVPVAMVAVFVPQGRDSGSMLRITLGAGSVSALGHALEVSYAPVGSLPSWQALALGAWATGTVLFVLYLAALQRVFVRSLGKLRGSRCVVQAERSAGCPALLGVLRPKIILPLDFKLRYTPQERLLIFSHERAHLRRGDPAWNALAASLRCVFWFNPLAHLASSYFRVDQELACDAEVLEEYSGLRRAYASAMLKTELADAALPVGCNWRSMYHLKERLQMVKTALPGRTRRACSYVCVALASLIVGCSTRAIQPVTAVTARGAEGPEPIAKLLDSMFAPGSVRVAGQGLTIEDAGDVTRVGGRELQLMFAEGVLFDLQADHANFKADGSGVLEGHVRITSRAVRVTHAADHVTLTVEADRAVMTRKPGGGVRFSIKNGSVQL